MNWCVNFPKEMVLICRPSLRKACGQNRNAAKFMSYLLYRASIREEAKVEAQNINAVKVQQGKTPDQDTSITVYRTQGQVIQEMDEELSDRTLRDDAVPCLVELGYLTFEEFKGAKQYTAYTIYPEAIQKGIDHPNQIPHFKKMKYYIEREEVKAARKNFRTENDSSEKSPLGKISEPSGKNSEPSGRISEPSKPAKSASHVASEGKFGTYKSNNKENTLRENTAHVSDDNALSRSSSSLSQYDLLLAYRDNQLEHLYECEKAAMVNMSQKLSPNRAGELAAAKLSVQFCEQYVRFKNEVDNLARTSSAQVTPEQEALYDWLVDNWNVRADLTTLSGTRTLILDEDMYRSSLTPPPSEENTAQGNEQSSEQAVSYSQSEQNNDAARGSQKNDAPTASTSKAEATFASDDERVMWDRLTTKERSYYARMNTQERNTYNRWCSLFKKSRPTLGEAMFNACRNLGPSDYSSDVMNAIKKWCFANDNKTANFPKGYYKTRGVKLWDIAEKAPDWETVQEQEREQDDTPDQPTSKMQLQDGKLIIDPNKKVSGLSYFNIPPRPAGSNSEQRGA